MVVFCLKKNLNASRPSEQPPVREEKCQNVQVGSNSIWDDNNNNNIGSKDKTSSWHLIGFPKGSNIGSTA